MIRIFPWLKFFLAGLCLWPAVGMGADAIAGAEHRQELDAVMQQANNLEAKNLNRFALEALYRYTKLFDSLYQVEKKDTLRRITAAFDSESAARRQMADSLAKEVKTASLAKEELRQKSMRLLRKGVIALVIYVALVAIFVFFRLKIMRRNRNLLATSEAALGGYSTHYEAGENLLKLGTRLESVAQPISRNAESLQAVQEELKQQVKSGALESTSVRGLQATLNEMTSLQEKQDGILQAVRLQAEPAATTREETDINKLCRHYLELAAAGMTGDGFECKVTTDFEKRLPPVKVFPQAIGNLLLHLFANSYESMKARAVVGGKTYKPALAVSTRVLPRFIQVRVKDNGTGIDDAELAKIFDYFYSLNPPASGAGIGLSEAQRIMKEMHNGELAMESDPERGTDVYLKFFTVHEKA